MPLIQKTAQYNVNQAPKKPIPNWLPLVIGALLVVLLAGLGIWQINRGLDKQVAQQAFDAQSAFATWSNGMQIRPHQKLEVAGRPDADHQILLDNIIINSRNGYYVLTSLAVAQDEPLLIVNRGWLEKDGPGFDPRRIGLDVAHLTVRGRVGSLPKAGYRMGDALQRGAPWPQHAVYPTLAELADALGRDVQPFVLLMDADEEHGFLRSWAPAEMGPAKHFAYAFQWFAMATVLGALLCWHSRKRWKRRG